MKSSSISHFDETTNMLDKYLDTITPKNEKTTRPQVQQMLLNVIESFDKMDSANKIECLTTLQNLSTKVLSKAPPTKTLERITCLFSKSLSQDIKNTAQALQTLAHTLSSDTSTNVSPKSLQTSIHVFMHHQRGDLALSLAEKIENPKEKASALFHIACSGKMPAVITSLSSSTDECNVAFLKMAADCSIGKRSDLGKVNPAIAQSILNATIPNAISLPKSSEYIISLTQGQNLPDKFKANILFAVGTFGAVSTAVEQFPQLSQQCKHIFLKLCNQKSLANPHFVAGMKESMIAAMAKDLAPSLQKVAGYSHALKKVFHEIQQAPKPDQEALLFQLLKIDYINPDKDNLLYKAIDMIRKAPSSDQGPLLLEMAKIANIDFAVSKLKCTNRT